MLQLLLGHVACTECNGITQLTEPNDAAGVRLTAYVSLSVMYGAQISSSALCRDAK